jgi:YegS/Rv2252/BmrU family lipid kinase
MINQNQSKTLVLNPVSGNGDHTDSIQQRATLTGYDVVETEAEGDAIELAKAAANRDCSVIAAAGGDGTLNEVVCGVVAADALDRVTVGVVPVGTGNNFAQNIGITGIDHAFDVLEDREHRWIDLGVADGNHFINSCISGITADASGDTTPEMKNRFGVVAYVINTFETINNFDGLELSVEVWQEGEHDPIWSGEAMMILVGNGRRFSLQGNTQANMEDGRFDVTIIENAPASELIEEALAEHLFGKESTDTKRLRASSLELTGLGSEPLSFSLDGEIIERKSLTLDVENRVLSVPVGDAYEPNPSYE